MAAYRLEGGRVKRSATQQEPAAKRPPKKKPLTHSVHPSTLAAIGAHGRLMKHAEMSMYRRL